MLVYSGTQFDVKLGKNYSIDLLRTNLILNGFPYLFSGQHSGTRQACLETVSSLYRKFIQLIIQK